MEKTVKAGRKVRGEWEYKKYTKYAIRDGTGTSWSCLGQEHRAWKQQCLSSSWPCCSVFNFKGALSREQGDTSNPPALSHGLRTWHSPPVLQQQHSQNHAGSGMQRAGTTATALRAGNYCTLQPCVCALCCKQSTSGTGIHNPTLSLDTWLLAVFLSLKGNPFLKARAASSSRQGHQVLQLQEL